MLDRMFTLTLIVAVTALLSPALFAQSDNAQITGTITDGSWSADLTAYRSSFNRTSNPSPWQGTYTIVFPGQTSDPTLPAGNGYGTIKIDGPSTASRMKRLVIRKNLNRAVVLYGYSVSGRLIADEVLSKLWLLNNRIQRGRGDAALVRVVVPVDDNVDAAEQRGLSFAREFLPYVVRLWS